MKVILTKDVSKLGRKFDTKEVSSGYALNLLIPRGLAVIATEDAVKKLGAVKAREDGEKKINDDLLIKNIKGLDGISISVSDKANEKGHLFAGLHKEEIVAELKKQTELQIDPSFIQLEHPLKEVGEHIIGVAGGGKSAKFKIVIQAVK